VFLSEFFFTVRQGLAGGWAVIRLDSLPRQIVAGSPTKFGFRVLQHGQNGFGGLIPTISFWDQSETGRLDVAASPEGETGHYIAEVIFLVAG
jgi:hypothetical protein